MNKLKHLAVAGLAAAAIGAGALVAPPTASAAVSCEQATAIAEFYSALAQVERAHGNTAAALAWIDRAFAVVLNAC